MGINRVVNTDFWNDEKVLDNFTPEDKYFWLYLLTNPQTKQLGVYKLPIKIVSFQTGYNEDAVEVLLKRFEKVYNMIKYNFETQEVAILNYMKWSIIKGGKPVEDCIKADMEKVKDKSLIVFVYQHLQESDATKTVTLENIYNYIEENYTTEETAPTKKAKEDTKHKYGEYKNVLLTEAEHERLLAEENGERAIEFLSEYIKMKGYKAKDHNLAIRKWVFGAIEEQDTRERELKKRQERLTGATNKKQGNVIDTLAEIYNEVG